ncbi:MAG: hypothetical protein ACLPJW_20405 [Rhodomicrobium sp.]
MPQRVKWSLLGGIAIVCAGAAYLMVARGPVLLLDLGNALAGCF